MKSDSVHIYTEQSQLEAVVARPFGRLEFVYGFEERSCSLVMEPHLSVFNSLTCKKERLTLREDQSYLSWYICGPTVYDSSHVGHARNYVSFDTIRRLLTDFFRVPVRYQINVTDIDDKIIQKSLETGELFSTVARRYEEEFFADLEALHCRAPDTVTRVSEYIPEIASYIREIMDKGYAYEAASGSIYFDVEAFERNGGHCYGKLKPSAAAAAAGPTSSLAAQREATNEIDQLSLQDEKRNPRDFALWKASKSANEPGWEENGFTRGRPGWHIECSVMASLVSCAGTSQLDLHSGGVDLKFPHHDNEIAQAEAFFGTDHWCRYFLHSGHLNIEGLKMSKSLKNFITIREVLRRWNWRQLRVLFLMHHYQAGMNYSEESMADAAAVERGIQEFMRSTTAELRACPPTERYRKPTRMELQLLYEVLPATEARIRAQLADNFNTPEAMQTLLTFIRAVNHQRHEAVHGLSYTVLQHLRYVVGHTLSCLGLDYDAVGQSDSRGEDTQTAVEPWIQQVVNLRDQVRETLLSSDSSVETSTLKERILRICDEFRDVVLPPLGIRLEDRVFPKRAIWKYDDPSAIQDDVARRKQAEAAQAVAKEARRKEAEKRLIEELRQGRTDPVQMFRIPSEYSRWREDGIPTHDAEGHELEKSRIKRLMKEQQRQERLHRKFLEAQASGLLSKLGIASGDSKEN
jgi:cysteinyl-tRNA synthetase